MRSLLFLILLTFLLPACSLFSPVQVRTAHVQTEPPSRVTVALLVDQGSDPVDFLEKNHFSIYETDVLLSPEEIHLELLPRDQVSRAHTVLLVDVSGQLSEEELQALERGATHFIEKVSTTSSVTVLGLDGSEKVRKIASFEKLSEPRERPLPSLRPPAHADSSRDLHGAVLQALTLLEEQISQAQEPIQLGQLVVLVRGPDLAGRVTQQELQEKLRESSFDHYGIFPEELQLPLRSALSSTASITYQDLAELPLRFQDLGMRVRKAYQRVYALTYCSPARAGTRQLTVRLEYTDDEGRPLSGQARTEFDATGFEAGCTPTRKQSGTPSSSSSASSPSSPAPANGPSSTPAPPASTEETIIAPPSSEKYR